MNRWWKGIVAIGLLGVFLAAVAEDREGQGGIVHVFAGDSTPAGELSAKPIDLFQGAAAPLRAFLGPMSGAVELHYRGGNRVISTVIEIWENGVKTKTLTKSSQPLPKGSFDGEFAISVKEDYTSDTSAQDVVTSTLIQGKDYATSVARYNMDPAYRLQGTLLLPHEKAVPEKDSLLVWGIQSTDQNMLHTIDLDDASLAKTKWAMVCRISLSD